MKDEEIELLGGSAAAAGFEPGERVRRPVSVTVVAWLFILAGGVGTVYHASEIRTGQPLPHQLFWILAVRLLAVLCGVYLLPGKNWARWGILMWLAYHVVLSGFHDARGSILHAVLLGIIAYLLLRPPAAAFFRSVSMNNEEREGETTQSNIG